MTCRERKILIVEDQPLWSDLLARTLSTEEGINIVGQTADGETAIEMARELQPDAVLMDIGLAGKMDGIESALQIKEERPRDGHCHPVRAQRPALRN